MLGREREKGWGNDGHPVAAQAGCSVLAPEQGLSPRGGFWGHQDLLALPVANLPAMLGTRNAPPPAANLWSPLPSESGGDSGAGTHAPVGSQD